MQKGTDLNNIIAFERVAKEYFDGVASVRDVTFSVHPGEFVSILGPSGCGKSTILKLIAGIEHATRGTIIAPHNRAMVFQNGALLPWLSALDNAAFGLHMRGEDTLSARKKALTYLDMLGIREFSKSLPRELSGGQRQRVGIARALAIEPSILLLDEPFSALDETTRFELYRDLQKIWGHTHLTVVMVSHSVEESVLLSDRIVLMRDRSIGKEVTVSLARPRDTDSHAFNETVHQVRSIAHRFATENL